MFFFNPQEVPVLDPKNGSLLKPPPCRRRRRWWQATRKSRARAAPAPAAAAPAAKPEPLKIAFAYIGPVGDGGWTFAHDNGRKAVEKEFGDRVVTSFVEKVPESADAERVIRDMVGQGNKLIFGTTFGYMESMVKVAADHPDVKFEHATGYKTAPNLRTYDSRTYEGAYMAGVIAGRMTQSNVLGVVGRCRSPRCCATSTASRWARRAPTRRSPPRWCGSTTGSTRPRRPRPPPPDQRRRRRAVPEHRSPAVLKTAGRKASAPSAGTAT